jgi:uncharacterized protein involved in exopolysaccharide biosynthesis/protein involved in polysaccharide export with SLBB domain
MKESDMNKELEKGPVGKEEGTLVFRELCDYYVSNWKWFLASVVAFLLAACIYLWFTPTKVNVTGKLRIMDKSKQSSQLSMGMSMLNSLPMGLGSSLGGGLGAVLGGGIESEQEILLSNNLSKEVVSELGLYTEYRQKKWGRKNLLYQNQPVSVTVAPELLKTLEAKLPLKNLQIRLLITKSGDSYTVETVVKENKEKTELPEETFSHLPATIETGLGPIVLSENTQLTEQDRESYQDGYTLQVTIIPPSERAADFLEHLTAEPSLNKAPDIIGLTLEDESVVRGVDFVNTLVELYNKYINEEKNEEALKTDEFVNKRLANLDVELGHSDEAWEKSKKSFQVTEPSVDAQEIMTKRGQYEAQLVSFGTQIQLQDYLNEYVNDPTNLFELIPVNVGVYGGDALPMISQHNTLITQRRELLKSVSEQSPVVKKINLSIQELHPNIQTAMKRDRQSLLIKRQSVEREYDRYNSRVTNTPQAERVLTEIGRQREIKQGVYLLMLQQREETAMQLANITDKGKLIDAVRAVRYSNHPKKKVVLLGALLLGLLFPMPFLFMSATRSRQIFKSASVMVLALFMFSACMSTKNVPYFTNMDEISTSDSKVQYEAKIMPKDILQIKVFSTTPGMVDAFNLEKTPVSSSSTTDHVTPNSVYNYIVDSDGDIIYPVIGSIHVGGLTRKEAETLIKSKVAPYMSPTEDYLVHVRMINYKYSVLGEVRSPGTFHTQNEKVNIIEAIAQAGDLTLYGLRDRVFLIRENSDGQKEFHRLNLNDANIVSSPYFYLQQNDIIYVEPNKAQARSSFFSTTSSIWLSITSALVSLSTLIIAIAK